MCIKIFVNLIENILVIHRLLNVKKTDWDSLKMLHIVSWGYWKAGTKL